jgi:uncharacterized protein YjbI with pentapeptide repeats
MRRDSLEEITMRTRTLLVLLALATLAGPASRAADFEHQTGDTVSVTLSPSLEGTGLENADLADRDLGGSYLPGADAQGVYAPGTSLQEGNLAFANLQTAYLADANLRDSMLAGANLQEADLSGADLRGADLSGAILQGANLRGAHLDGANLEGALLQGASLAGASGLTQTQLQNACADRTIGLAHTGLAFPRHRPCCDEPGGCVE